MVTLKFNAHFICAGIVDGFELLSKAATQTATKKKTQIYI